MIVLGIDPGTRVSGIAIVRGGPEHRVIRADVVRSPDGVTSGDRLESQIAGIEAFVGRFGDLAGFAAIEENFIRRGNSPRNALSQREVIGAAIVAVQRLGLEVVRVTPNEAKKALTGSGKADKAAMMRFAGRVFGPDLWAGFPHKYQREAIADAVGIALAGMTPTMAKWRR